MTHNSIFLPQPEGVLEEKTQNTFLCSSGTAELHILFSIAVLVVGPREDQPVSLVASSLRISSDIRRQHNDVSTCYRRDGRSHR